MDRHYVITNPLQVAGTMTMRHAMMSLVFVWIWSFIWSSPPLFGWGGRYKPDGFQTSCTFDYVTQTTNNITFNLCMYSFSFVVPVVLIFYYYIGIVREMFRHSRQLKKQTNKADSTVTQRDHDKKNEFQIAKVAAITVLSFLVSWTPYAVIGVCGLIFKPEDKKITPVMSEIAVMFAKASAAYNPVIYAFSHPKFRAELGRRFPILIGCCPPPASAKGLGHSSISMGSISTTTTTKVITPTDKP